METDSLWSSKPISLITNERDSIQSGSMGTDVSPDKLDFIGDHLAINFINTLRARLGEPFEVLKRDDDVRDWFRRAGLSRPSKSADWSHGALLRKARQLREIALTAIEVRKNGRRLLSTL